MRLCPHDNANHKLHFDALTMAARHQFLTPGPLFPGHDDCGHALHTACHVAQCVNVFGHIDLAPNCGCQAVGQADTDCVQHHQPRSFDGVNT